MNHDGSKIGLGKLSAVETGPFRRFRRLREKDKERDRRHLISA